MSDTTHTCISGNDNGGWAASSCAECEKAGGTCLHPDHDETVRCPACRAEAVFVESVGRHFHLHGIDNRECWETIDRTPPGQDPRAVRVAEVDRIVDREMARLAEQDRERARLASKTREGARVPGSPSQFEEDPTEGRDKAIANKEEPNDHA